MDDLNNWTIETWFRLSTTLTTGVQITSVVSNQFNLVDKLNFSIGTNRQPSSANICVGFYDGSWRTTNGFTAESNVWYHVIGTYDGSIIRQYLNGVEQSTLNYEGTPRSGGEVRIARRWDGNLTNNNMFPGDISMIRIWDSPLTQIEVENIFNSSKNRYEL